MTPSRLRTTDRGPDPGSLPAMPRDGETPVEETAAASSAQQWSRLDRAYALYLDEHPDPPGGSLLAQTILTGASRRGLYPLIGLEPDARILDLGTGFGPVVLELARLQPVRAVGVDLDAAVLRVATDLGASLADWLAPGAQVRFERAGAETLPFEDASFDLVTARLLFQHLSDPERVVREVSRVLRRGGSAFVFDVDDGFGVSYPPPSGALAVLEAAFAACQSGRGGDREVGRKLTTYFTGAGFTVGSIRLLAQAAHVASEAGDTSRSLTTARLLAVRAEIVDRGVLTAHEFDTHLEQYSSEPPVARFRAESQLAVVFTKP